MGKYCVYDETACCNMPVCAKCEIRIKAKYAFEGNKMWNKVKEIIQKFEYQSPYQKKETFEKLTDAEKEILKDFYYPLLDTDEEIFIEICKQT